MDKPIIDRDEKLDELVTDAEAAAIDRNTLTSRPTASVARNNIFILAQILLLIIGLTLCVAFIGTILFLTAPEVEIIN